MGGKRGTTLESGWGGRVHGAQGLDVGNQGGGATGMMARCPAGTARQRVMLINQTGNLKGEGGL